jgi:homogentisate 1,2-dioxygenase
LSGSSFTTPRLKNQRSWLYRVRPCAAHQPFRPASHTNKLLRSNFDRELVDPSQLRWQPFSMPAADQSVDWVQGLVSMCGAGAPDLKTGMGIHIYTCNTSMVDRAFCNSDGDMLIVPQEGALTIRTEYGYLHVKSGEICVIQRGVRFAVAVDGPSRGYVCEIFKGRFILPDLGPIGLFLLSSTN